MATTITRPGYRVEIDTYGTAHVYGAAGQSLYETPDTGAAIERQRSMREDIETEAFEAGILVSEWGRG